MVEPVDAGHRPVPPGERSHTVLISNLANRVQPILRYDLGDSVVLRPDPCPCGSPLPAARVQGRTADLLGFPTRGGGRTAMSPLLVAILLDHAPGVDQVQIVQTAPDVLRVRLRPARDADREEVWRRLREEPAGLLAEHRVDGVAIERVEEPPERSPGGKFRRIVPLAAAGG
ncbi:hypothetical protein [Allonocardiopsis opalescens]|uniref:AMP-binding enzyme n=1 Tax=Allonocardiopsis opalescens TaxID=1144618 RepID=A0A2T0QEY1_9ACTN|nr:hypothetical protein [Allonocardiopsis opalescens]PRY02450.1 hypothetical protein CLV72_1011052 [Allonocardiopsis opalescens]